jgi:endophilin-B
LGKADAITTYDDEFETLCNKVDQIKLTTERILATLDTMAQPNPNIRIEEMIYSKLDKIRPHHSSPHELLGVELSRAGNEFGPETQYGGYLVRCGQVENKIGSSERRLQLTVRTEVIASLKIFLENDLKNIAKDRRTLQVIRLDLDACKAYVKKAQPGEKMQQAESQLRLTQAEYDIQMGKLRSNMEKIVQTHVNNLGHMKTLMAALKTYYSECLAHLEEIDYGSNSTSLPISSLPVKNMEYEVDEDEARNARVIYDYDDEESDLSVLSDQVITVYPIGGDDDNYLALVNNKFGKIPAGYIELL